ncbi:hypothetical protein KKF84_19555, partial [Myxococcota bacterium]|nr:hypothetical protein [Myxococcota bacterium]
MKIMRFFNYVFIILLTGISFIGCGDADTDTEDTQIAWPAREPSLGYGSTNTLWPFTRAPSSIVGEDNLLYTVRDGRGLEIFDPEGAAGPARVGVFPVEGVVGKVAQHNGIVAFAERYSPSVTMDDGSLVYREMTSTRLYVVDATDPAHPVELARQEIAATVHHIGFMDDIIVIGALQTGACTGCDSEYVQVLTLAPQGAAGYSLTADLKEPIVALDPVPSFEHSIVNDFRIWPLGDRLVFSWDISENGTQTPVRSGQVFIAHDTGETGSFQWLTGLDQHNMVSALVVQDTVVTTTLYNGTVQVDFWTPQADGSLSVAADPVTINGHEVYDVTSTATGLIILSTDPEGGELARWTFIDCTAPGEPNLLGSTAAPFSGARLASTDDRLFAVSQNGVWMFDSTTLDPFAFTHLASSSFPEQDSLPVKVQAGDGRLYVEFFEYIESTFYYATIDASSVEDPQPLGNPCDGCELVVHGGESILAHVSHLTFFEMAAG